MKKYLVALCLSLSLVAVPSVSFAATTQCQNDGNIDPDVAGLFNVKYCSATDLIVGIVKIILALAGIVAVLFVAIGGFRYITSAGEEGTKAAKSMITSALIGLVIVIMAYTLISITVNLVGGPSGGNDNQGGVSPISSSTADDNGLTLCDDDDSTVAPPCG